MDPTLLDVIRVKVHAFRISEAKEVLTQLGLPKHGRKEELHARILTIFQDAATLTAQGHKLRDQARVDSAAAIVDSVFRRLLKSEYAPAVTAAHKLRQQGQFTDSADADDRGPNKRPRIGNPLMPHHRAFGRAAGAGSAGARSDVDEVITAFVNGEEDIGPSNTKVRCVCTQHVRKEPMLQCEGPFCGVWQHAACVKQQLLHSQLVPHPPGSDKWPKRRQFFCERCRIARADPFWEVYDTLVMPPQLGKATAGRMRVQNYHNQSEEWTVSMAGPAKVNLSSSQLRLLRDSPHEYQLQAMALCLDDQVQFRTQWPTAPMLRWGTRQLRVVNRTNGTALGVMQRDAPANLTPLLPLAGVQQDSGGMTLDLSLEYADPKHTVLLLAYIMRRRTREQVKALMKAPEPLAAAVQRVRNFVKPHGAASSTTNPAAAAANGPRHHQQQQQQPAAAATAAAAAAVNDDIVISDEDDDIVVGNRVVSLKDPNTFSRIKQPARFTDTSSNDLLAFELESFLDVAEKTLKWIDPHSMKASCVQNLQVDTYLAQVLAGLAQQPDVLEVEINEDAEWRPAGSTGPFMSVLDPNAAALAAAAAGGGGDLTSDEEDEAAELRRAASEVRRGKQHEVIELLDSDDEAEAPQQQQQQQQQPAAAGGSGLRIQLPSRAAQQQTHLQQQAATANMAAAAVGPPVPHAAPGVGAHLQGAGGVMSPRVVAGNPQPQQQQQQQQQQWQQQGLPPQQQQQFVGNLPPGFTLQRVGSGVPPQQQQQQQPGAPPPGVQYAQVVGPGMVRVAGNQLYIPVVSSGGMLLGPGGMVLQGGVLQAGGQQVQLQMAQGQQGYLQQQPGQVVYLPQQQQQQQQQPPQGQMGR